MIGTYHEHRDAQMEQSHAGYDADLDVPTDDPSTPAQPQTPSRPGQQSAQAGGGSRNVHPDVAARNDVTYSVADEDTDWQFCEQCQGMFEPDGEYDAHFDSPDFRCVRE